MIIAVRENTKGIITNITCRIEKLQTINVGFRIENANKKNSNKIKIELEIKKPSIKFSDVILVKSSSRI